jgi:hypothetical protein
MNVFKYKFCASSANISLLIETSSLHCFNETLFLQRCRVINLNYFNDIQNVLSVRNKRLMALLNKVSKNFLLLKCRGDFYACRVSIPDFLLFKSHRRLIFTKCGVAHSKAVFPKEFNFSRYYQ